MGFKFTVTSGEPAEYNLIPQGFWQATVLSIEEVEQKVWEDRMKDPDKEEVRMETRLKVEYAVDTDDESYSLVEYLRSSSHVKSTLYNRYSAVIGLAPPDDTECDTDDMIGGKCNVLITHKTSTTTGRTYHNIAQAMPFTQSKPEPDPQEQVSDLQDSQEN